MGYLSHWTTRPPKAATPSANGIQAAIADLDRAMRERAYRPATGYRWCIGSRDIPTPVSMAALQALPAIPHHAYLAVNASHAPPRTRK